MQQLSRTRRSGGSTTTLTSPSHSAELPKVVLENVCVLWLTCTTQGGDPSLFPFPAYEAPVLTKDDQIQNVLKDTTPMDAMARGLACRPWTCSTSSSWWTHPELCHRLVKKCICCQTWPADLAGHVCSPSSRPLACSRLNPWSRVVLRALPS